jgi:uncharacterized protein YndB with AHSA1/START domain
VRTNLDIEIEIDIARPVAAVWAVVSDFERLPQWLGEFEESRVESAGPVGVGAVIGYTLQGNRSGTFEITEWEPPRRLAWDGPPLRWAGGSARPRGSHTLSDSEAGQTHLVSRYQPELTGLQVLPGPYLRRWLSRQRRADSKTLEALVTGATERVKAQGGFDPQQGDPTSR